MLRAAMAPSAALCEADVLGAAGKYDAADVLVCRLAGRGAGEEQAGALRGALRGCARLLELDLANNALESLQFIEGLEGAATIRRSGSGRAFGDACLDRGLVHALGIRLRRVERSWNLGRSAMHLARDQRTWRGTNALSSRCARLSRRRNRVGDCSSFVCPRHWQGGVRAQSRCRECWLEVVACNTK